MSVCVWASVCVLCAFFKDKVEVYAFLSMHSHNFGMNSSENAKADLL